MSERKESASASWLKALLGAIAGLFSGALVMYLSPLVDKVVKPPRPIANFAIDYDGLTVRFTNRSSGAVEGYWDFGDGSPLEFLSSDQPVVTHSYRKPGNYVARLVVSNLLGEQDERSVTLDLTQDNKPKAADKPMILTLNVRGPSRGGGPVYAPATFHFEAIADNASQFVWDFGDGQGLHLGDSRVVRTFENPGTYRVRLAVFNGSEKDEQEKVIRVAAPPAGVLRVQLRVADSGTLVETRRREVLVSQMFDLGKADQRGRKVPVSLEVTVPAVPGFVITAFERLEQSSQHLEKVDWRIVKDGQHLKAACLPKKGADRAVLHEKLIVVEQRREKVQPEPATITGSLSVPGVTTLQLPPVPEDWEGVQRLLTVEIADDSGPLWQGDALPSGQTVVISGRPFVLSSSQVKDRVTLQLASPLTRP